MAYKRDINDERESPALKIFELLEEAKAHVTYYDPFVPRVKPHTFFSREIRSVALTEEILAEQDCVVVTTDHSTIDYQWVVDHSRLVVDSRNATKQVTQHRDRIVLL